MREKGSPSVMEGFSFCTFALLFFLCYTFKTECVNQNDTICIDR